MRKALIFPLLLAFVAFGSTFPLATYAQSAVALPPVPNYQDRDPSDEDLGSCSNGINLGVLGDGVCATAITSEADLLGLSGRGLTLAVGDVMRCISNNADSFASRYSSFQDRVSTVCTATHPDGSADTAAEITTANTEFGGVIASRTDAAGNTTSTEGSDDLVDRAGDAAQDTAAGWVQDAGEAALQAIATIILQFSTLLLGWAGSLLNWVMLRGVFQFSQLIGNSPGLLLAWGILRDLGNILLLFGFIFIGVSTILGTSKFGDKKALPKLLIFAILMNFSLFAAEAVIDTANVLASTIYNQASIDSCDVIESGPAQLGGDGGGDVKECALEYGLAGHMIQSSGLASVYAAENPAVETATKVGLAAFITIGAVVIFAASFMLITRAIALTFLMITSPIGFAGMALPPMQKFAQQWWSKLLHQAFYAPILILMILISLKITDSFTSNLVGGRNLGAAIQTPTAASMGVLFIFALVIGFMIASITAAKKFGIAGSDFAMNLVNKTARLPLGAARGLGGSVGRRTIGAGSARAQKGWNSLLARNKALSGVTRFTGLDRAISKGLEKGQNAKFGSSASFKSRKAEDAARDKELGEVARKDRKTREFGDADTASRKAARELEAARERGNDNEIKEAEEKYEAANDKLAEVLEGLSAKEIEELGVLKKSGADLQRIAESLSPEKFGALMKEGSAVSEAKKEELRKARFQKLTEVAKSVREDQQIIASTTATQAQKDAARARLETSKKKLRDVTKGYSARDLQNMSSEDLNNDALLMSLTNSQRDDLLKSNNVSPAIARKIRRYDPVEQVKAIFKNNPSEAAARMRSSEMKLNTAQVARLGIEVLESAEIARVLKVSEIKAIEKREEFGVDERARLKAAIENSGNVAVEQYMRNTESGRENWT